MTTHTFHSIESARRAARRRLPRAVYDYIDGGADDEATLHFNRQSFGQVTFRPRMATGVSRPDLTTRLLGEDLAVPILLAPCGFAQVVHQDGEAGAARAAHLLRSTRYPKW